MLSSIRARAVLVVALALFMILVGSSSGPHYPGRSSELRERSAPSLSSHPTGRDAVPVEGIVVHVSVTDARSWRFVNGARVSISPDGGDPVVLTTNRTGMVARVVQIDLPAVLSLEVSASGYRSESYRIQVWGNLSYAVHLDPIAGSRILQDPANPLLIVGVVLVGVVALVAALAYQRYKRPRSKRRRRWWH